MMKEGCYLLNVLGRVSFEVFFIWVYFIKRLSLFVIRNNVHIWTIHHEMFFYIGLFWLEEVHKYQNDMVHI